MPATLQQPNKAIILRGVVILLLLLFCVTLTGAQFIVRLIGPQNIGARFFVSRALYWGCLAFAWYYCTIAEKQKLLIWPEKEHSFWVYLLSVLVIYVVLSIGSAFIFMLFKFAGVGINQVREKTMMAMLRGRYTLIFTAAITAAIVEELLFRGYLIPRLEAVFNNRYVAVIISSVLFGLLHFTYNNWYHIAIAGFIGLVFALHYVKYRNIKILMISHFLWDIIIILANAR